MDKPGAENDIKLIKDIMERSARYTHFTGLSGILSGLAALAGVYATCWIYVKLPTDNQAIWSLVTWVLVFVFALVEDFALAARRAKKEGTTIWTPATKQVLKAIAPAVFMSFVISMSFLFKGPPDAIPGILAMGYGVALCSAGMFCSREVWIYGIVQLITGTISFFFLPTLPYSMYTMALCFGIYQIAFGVWIAAKYRR